MISEMERAKRFKEARMNMTGKPLDAVAEESGVSKNTIWKLEHNKVDAGYKVPGWLVSLIPRHLTKTVK